MFASRSSSVTKTSSWASMKSRSAFYFLPFTRPCTFCFLSDHVACVIPASVAALSQFARSARRPQHCAAAGLLFFQGAHFSGYCDLSVAIPFFPYSKIALLLPASAVSELLKENLYDCARRLRCEFVFVCETGSHIFPFVLSSHCVRSTMRRHAGEPPYFTLPRLQRVAKQVLLDLFLFIFHVVNSVVTLRAGFGGAGISALAGSGAHRPQGIAAANYHYMFSLSQFP